MTIENGAEINNHNTHNKKNNNKELQHLTNMNNDWRRFRNRSHEQPEGIDDFVYENAARPEVQEEATTKSIITNTTENNDNNFCSKNNSREDDSRGNRLKKTRKHKKRQKEQQQQRIAYLCTVFFSLSIATLSILSNYCCIAPDVNVTDRRFFRPETNPTKQQRKLCKEEEEKEVLVRKQHYSGKNNKSDSDSDNDNIDDRDYYNDRNHHYYGDYSCSDIFRYTATNNTTNSRFSSSSSTNTVAIIIKDHCRFAQTCNDGDGIFLSWTFCSSSVSYRTWFILLGPVTLIWLMTLFRVLGSTAEDYFSPSLEMFSNKLGLPPRFAGVSLLALGNGAPDVSATIASITSDPRAGSQLALGALTGAAMFTPTIVLGAVIMANNGLPFRGAFIRDCVMYGCAAVAVLYHLHLGYINYETTIIFASLYVSFVLIVCFADIYHRTVVLPALLLQERRKEEELDRLLLQRISAERSSSHEKHHHHQQKNSNNSCHHHKVVSLGEKDNIEIDCSAIVSNDCNNNDASDHYNDSSVASSNRSIGTASIGLNSAIGVSNISVHSGSVTTRASRISIIDSFMTSLSNYSNDLYRDEIGWSEQEEGSEYHSANTLATSSAHRHPAAAVGSSTPSAVTADDNHCAATTGKTPILFGRNSIIHRPSNRRGGVRRERRSVTQTLNEISYHTRQSHDFLGNNISFHSHLLLHDKNNDEAHDSLRSDQEEEEEEEGAKVTLRAGNTSATRLNNYKNNNTYDDYSYGSMDNNNNNDVIKPLTTNANASVVSSSSTLSGTSFYSASLSSARQQHNNSYHHYHNQPRMTRHSRTGMLLTIPSSRELTAFENISQNCGTGRRSNETTTITQENNNDDDDDVNDVNDCSNVDREDNGEEDNINEIMPLLGLMHEGDEYRHHYPTTAATTTTTKTTAGKTREFLSKKSNDNSHLHTNENNNAKNYSKNYWCRRNPEQRKLAWFNILLQCLFEFKEDIFETYNENFFCDDDDYDDDHDDDDKKDEDDHNDGNNNNDRRKYEIKNKTTGTTATTAASISSCLCHVGTQTVTMISSLCSNLLYYVDKILLITEFPFIILRKVTAPVPCDGYYNRGLIAISLLLSPFWFGFYLYRQFDIDCFSFTSTTNTTTMPVIMYHIGIMMVISVLVAIYAPSASSSEQIDSNSDDFDNLNVNDDEKKNESNNNTDENDDDEKMMLLPLIVATPIGLYGFVVAATWIDLVADFLVDVLNYLGIVAHIPNTIMGLTVLAWGNSMGDLSTNVSMVRKGLANMAATACFAAPTFNILIGLAMGFSSALRNMASTPPTEESQIESITTKGARIPVQLTAPVIIGLLFMITNSVSMLLVGLCMGKGKIPLKYGYFTFGLYVTYIIFSMTFQYYR